MPVTMKKRPVRVDCFVVAEARFELAASGLWARRATRLLYSAIFFGGQSQTRYPAACAFPVAPFWVRAFPVAPFFGLAFFRLPPFSAPGGAGDRDRTGTILSYHGILSPGRLPVPPHRRSHLGTCSPLSVRVAYYNTVF